MGEILGEAQAGMFEGPNFGHLATIRKDGTPAVTPMWVDYRDGLIYLNSAEGRLKVRNMRRDARVAISVYDQENPYRMVTVTGTVVEMTHAGADEHIDFLAKKYLGADSYPGRTPGEQRVIIKIRPERAAGLRT